MASLPWPGAVAVSGGGDSLALMHLLAVWARKTKAAPPLVLSVDHGLRKESAGDARKVKAWARALGLACEILTVKTPPPKSDIEAWARQARYQLLAERLARGGIATLYVGHHRDDQAETFLIRLGRGSGLDGLSAMRALAPFPLPGFERLSLARPLLGISRQALRDYLTARKQDWLEDTMNDETRFTRSRVRALLPALAEAGLSAHRIADAAAHLARARDALDLATAAVLARACRRPEGQSADQILLLDPVALAAAPYEIGLGALAALLQRVSGAVYRPRFEALERLFARLNIAGSGRGGTLHGCHIGPAPVRYRCFGPQTLAIARESSRKMGSNAR